MKCTYCHKNIFVLFEGMQYCGEECKQKRKKNQKKYQSNPEAKQKLKEYYSRPEIKKRIKNYVMPSTTVKDFFRYCSHIKFHSEEELEQTLFNYCKAACTIEGNCENIFARIKNSEEYKKKRIVI